MQDPPDRCVLTEPSGPLEILEERGRIVDDEVRAAPPGSDLPDVDHTRCDPQLLQAPVQRREGPPKIRVGAGGDSP
jgi:hypothetical protein